MFKHLPFTVLLESHMLPLTGIAGQREVPNQNYKSLPPFSVCEASVVLTSRMCVSLDLTHGRGSACFVQQQECVVASCFQLSDGLFADPKQLFRDVHNAVENLLSGFMYTETQLYIRITT